MAANPRIKFTIRPGWRSEATAPEQIEAVRRHCDIVNPVRPGGPRCCYPSCHHGDCRAEITGGLERMRR